MLLVLAALLAAALARPAAAGAARTQFGVQLISVTGSTDPAELDAQLDVAKRAGARQVRLQVPWSSLEPRASGAHDAATLAAADRTIAGAAQRGLRVVFFMVSTPCWASRAPASVRRGCAGSDPNAGAVTRYPPRHNADYVRVATFMAQRYGRKLAAFEIWNEPDQSNEYYWAGPHKVVRYVSLTRALYRPLKRANPQLTVLAGSFVGYNGLWLKALYKRGIRGYYDALSVHFYDLTLYGVRNTRAVQLANHDHKPVWVAESGWTSCAPTTENVDGHRCVTRAAQAQFLGDLIGSLRKAPKYVRSLIQYAAADGDTGPNQFGLVDVSGGAKPALGAFGAAVRGRPRVRALRVELARSGGNVVASGSGPAAEVYELRATVGGRLRYRRSFSLDTRGGFRLRLPASLGTYVKVEVRNPWLGRRARAST